MQITESMMCRFRQDCAKNNQLADRHFWHDFCLYDAVRNDALRTTALQPDDFLSSGCFYFGAPGSRRGGTNGDGM
jgi:hypothetical protein